MSDLNETPSSLRIQIGIFGKTNVGKSSLINALTNQDVSIVSDVKGTTTDPVFKSMEFGELGPCLFMDTPGSYDDTSLSKKRQDKMVKIMRRTDIAVIVVNDESDLADEEPRIEWFDKRSVPMVIVQNKIDLSDSLIKDAIHVSVKDNTGITKLSEAITDIGKKILLDVDKEITGELCSSKDVVMLVMPQDRSAPKGRLILAQVQTIRELLDKHCIIVSVTPEEITDALDSLKEPPKLIITDSQVFKTVNELKPKDSVLTSFSVLLAGVKGDIDVFKAGANAIDTLKDGANILISETCTHAPLEEDIGRVKIPNLIRKKKGIDINVTIASGWDFPEDLSSFDLIIQCGGCVTNRREIMSRINDAKACNVPITNYGVAIAKLNGINI
ncbi:MAG: [Lachnospiraceae bacterium]|nr:[FeFe] hydrogenase H-cluster maturation GTPase HydF [Lachnospiraceae bacterium]